MALTALTAGAMEKNSNISRPSSDIPLKYVDASKKIQNIDDCIIIKTEIHDYKNNLDTIIYDATDLKGITVIKAATQLQTRKNIQTYSSSYEKLDGISFTDPNVRDHKKHVTILFYIHNNDASKHQLDYRLFKALEYLRHEKGKSTFSRISKIISKL